MFKRKNKLEKIKGLLPYEIITQKKVFEKKERRIKHDWPK